MDDIGSQAVSAAVAEVEVDDQLSETLAALANPTRRAILERLATGDASVGELAEPFEMSLPAISRHIRVLERAGLVTQGRRAQYRPCSLNPEPLQAVASWTERHRKIWQDRFDRMDDYVRDLQAAADNSDQDNQQHPEQDMP